MLSLLEWPASAGDTSEIDRDAARTLVQQGDERLAARDYRGALKAYKRADDIMRVPTTAIEVGKVQLLLGQLREAHASFERAADHPAQAGEPAPFTEARRRARAMADRVKTQLAALSVEVASSAPRESITVAIDDELVEAWARPLVMNPGVHTVVVAAEAYQTTSEEIVLREGESRTLTVRLEQERAPSAATPEQTSAMWPMAYTGFAIAGLGALVGAVTGGLSLSQASKAKGHCDVDSGACTEEAREPLARSRTLAHVSTASFVVGGVGAALGITGLVLALDTESSTAWAGVTLGF